jgi:hypothetical protein
MDCDTPVILAMVAVGAIAITFELRMPCCGNLGLEGIPVEGLVPIDIDVLLAALLDQNVERIQRENALAPQRAVVGE